MTDVDKIVAMLSDPALEKRIAAAIVLGEIRAKGADVVDALLGTLDSGVSALQTPALHALARIGAKRAVDKALTLVTARDASVREAAAHAVASVGADVVPIVKKRFATATPDERRALGAILAEVGGKDAFGALLSGLAGSDAAGAEGAALAARAHLRDADPAEKRRCLTQTEAFVTAQSKNGANPAALSAAIKILGFLADEKALPTVLAFVTHTRQPNNVRQEAIIALRFVLPATGAAREKAVGALLECAAEDDPAIARTAMLTLDSVALSESHAARLKKLAEHPDFERSRLVLEKLGRQKDADAAKLLAGVLARADRRRAEVVIPLLTGLTDAAAPLAKALLDTNDPDRRWMIRNVLAPMAGRVPAGVRKQLLDAAVERIETGERGWEAFLDIAQGGDGKAASDALRELAGRVLKKHPERALLALTALTRTEHATDDDRWLFAMLELARSPRDLAPPARARDASLKEIQTLAERGYDVVGKIRKDRGLELDTVYYVGFHFAERRDPIGAELLRVVIDKGGRTKIAKMARSKLGLAEA